MKQLIVNIIKLGKSEHKLQKKDSNPNRTCKPFNKPNLQLTRSQIF